MRIVLFGKDGQVGWELQRALCPLGELIGFGSKSADLSDLDGLRKIVREAAPDVIVNAAAYTAVDKAESEPQRARRINAEALGVLAEEARRRGAWLIHYSTDYVFDGAKSTPYVEEDPTGPLSVYGTTKLEGEEAIRASGAHHLIFRTSWVYAVRGQNFAKTMLRLAHERERLQVVADQGGVPTSAEYIADVTALALYRLKLVPEQSVALSGTYHVTPRGETTWCDYARYVIQLARENGASLRVTPDRVEPIPTEAYPAAAKRPKNSRLDTRKLRTNFNVEPPDWRQHVARVVQELISNGAPWNAKG